MSEFLVAVFIAGQPGHNLIFTQGSVEEEFGAAGSVIQAESGAPTRLIGDPAEAEAIIEEEVTSFLIEALNSREALKPQSDEHKLVAEQLWTASSALVDAIRSADPKTQAGFIPVIENLRFATVNLQSNKDVNEAAAIARSINELTTIQNSPGIFDDGSKLVEVEVNALEGEAAANGYYVWLDLACCVSGERSFNPLPNTTSPASGAVVPGLYLIRLRKGGKTVSSREVLIGRTGSSERIDMVIVE
ncbi:hypothetical protein INR77_04235 [Erythrobacter sp. SCSIO 43205]|uniref:hypothetical protein n=1 Tax=Erythrobacter sp. SCSIO 43205 TaxID=2779361 RepID=UPI001CA9AFB3|nr:hypothetical protein [Erythrobacter sp. SCSIO 43205]UAB78916.1 hypothetical protein INR77_04235 [Erythrobacter sp. SCSIO 43205]